MEQIQQLIEILKSTPEMALWGIGLFFLFTLLKMSSWIYALATVANQLIKRLFDYKEKEVDQANKSKEREIEIIRIKMEQDKDQDFIKFLDSSLYGDKSELLRLFAKINGGKRMHSSDIDNVIDLINKHQPKKIKLCTTTA